MISRSLQYRVRFADPKSVKLQYCKNKLNVLLLRCHHQLSANWKLIIIYCCHCERWSSCMTNEQISLTLCSIDWCAHTINTNIFWWFFLFVWQNVRERVYVYEKINVFCHATVHPSFIFLNWLKSPFLFFVFASEID